MLCLLHGSTFLSIRSTGVVLDRAQAIARRLAIPAAVLVAGFVGVDLRAGPAGDLGGRWRWPSRCSRWSIAVPLVLGGRAGGRAFAATAVSIGGVIAGAVREPVPATC